MVRDAVLDRVLNAPDVKASRADIEQQVREGTLTPALAAEQLLNLSS
ncbi:putative kinase ArgK [Mycobacteroides abscessus subsp. abscessus]|nr:putative kinase ArgK [Mycobacteroides abscessus subsp. abscessus]